MNDLALTLSVLSIMCSLLGVFMLALSNKVVNTCKYKVQRALVVAVIAGLLSFASNGWFYLVIAVLCFGYFITTYRHYPQHPAGA